ncbi:MAG: DUF2207 domain-containing protein [Clostridia bacterium]|nr:DUF2207 domain-containing protein [Clostridia bacterium]
MKSNPSKIFLIIYVTLMIFCCFFPMVSWFLEDYYEESGMNPTDYARITDVEYTARLVDEPGSKGKVIITERLTFDIHAASQNNLFWELWRDLPEDYIDGVKVDYKVNSVKQILEDGTEIIFPESRKLYWEDEDYTDEGLAYGCGPNKWYHSPGPYNEYLEQYECVFFYVDGLYREQPVFEIEYEMNNAALRYNDCSELYLSMYSEDTIKHLKSFKGQILIPTSDMPSRGNYYAHTYGTNSNEFPFTESTSINPGYHTFSFELNEADLKFKPYNKYIEFSLVSFGKDKDKFTNYASINDYYYDDVLEEIEYEQKVYEETPNKYAQIKFIVFFGCLIFSFLILKRLLNADNQIENQYNFYKPTMQMDYFRDIPSNLDPMFAATLAFCKDKKKKDNPDGYAAIVLSLARKDYIELAKIDINRDWSDTNVKIVIKDKPVKLHPSLTLVQSSINEIFEDSIDEREPLTVTEELYFNLIKKHTIGSEISMKAFQARVSIDYDNTDTFVTGIENSTVNIGISQGYFQKANYNEPEKRLKSKSKSYAILGILILVFANLISYPTQLDLAFGGYTILGITLIFGSFIFKYLLRKYSVLLTQFGEDEYVKWKGLYDFLNSETLMSERTIVELPIWEQYLVYATAFGISEKVIKALKIRCPEIVETSQILSNPYYRSHNFYHSSRSFRSSVRSASSISRGGFSGGGHGGHGGYGGGGRGGGGGGGGH